MKKNYHVDSLAQLHVERYKGNTYKKHKQQTGWRNRFPNKILSVFKMHRKKSGDRNLDAGFDTSIHAAHFMKNTEESQRDLKVISVFDWVTLYIITVYACT